MTDEHPAPLAPSAERPTGVPAQTPPASSPPRGAVTGRGRSRGRHRAPGAPRTRVSAAFAGAVGGLFVLVALLVFILENTETVKINFLGASGRLGLGLALLVAAVAGALIVAILGGARIAQLRRLGKR